MSGNFYTLECPLRLPADSAESTLPAPVPLRSCVLNPWERLHLNISMLYAGHNGILLWLWPVVQGNNGATSIALLAEVRPLSDVADRCLILRLRNCPRVSKATISRPSAISCRLHACSESLTGFASEAVVACCARRLRRVLVSAFSLKTESRNALASRAALRATSSDHNSERLLLPSHICCGSIVMRSGIKYSLVVCLLIYETNKSSHGFMLTLHRGANLEANTDGDIDLQYSKSRSESAQSITVAKGDSGGFTRYPFQDHQAGA
ncbi:hypothetical protein BU25DRAFT_411602 [Macroventuria anomochaeta]|uniref:Uncharacterized protein n=1 Tax=Macroventuria anomochaeta TaxID=301207 RepID=A0ACB6S0H1_9PLEO|nr:uncharacterized protein BU25DRAFT_411602 [Macroventuria anomochaeta]KAF2626632.1 hypothetical protein BU25DRAFT_411602 [Macroventuria anomochaeta]